MGGKWEPSLTHLNCQTEKKSEHHPNANEEGRHVTGRWTLPEGVGDRDRSATGEVQKKRGGEDSNKAKGLYEEKRDFTGKSRPPGSWFQKWIKKAPDAKPHTGAGSQSFFQNMRNAGPSSSRWKEKRKLLTGRGDLAPNITK